ncbi:DOMON domain-containing protein [Roseobacter sinensis]|nr:DOMON domain-containing protein [Roseobacter sp. WL0113]
MLKSICALPLLPWAGAARAAGQIIDGDVSFDWHHTHERLTCALRAPTKGWLAVGFNADKTLKGTRFVMAALAKGVERVEDRIAVVPTHAQVETLGLSSALTDTEITHTQGGSILRFSYPVTFRDQPRLSLAPDSTVHLMLAWSQDTDFDHHSAWRKHYDITL